MEISYKWLKHYIDVDLTPSQIEALLTDCGLEVETIEKYESIKGGLENITIGKVITCEPHPNSDHLHITKVDVGRQQILNIVCGAANVAAGQHVAIARIGAVLHCNNGEILNIKKSKIRGIVSEGMICAEDELGIGENHEGILVLPETSIPGTPAKDYFKVESDTIFGIGLTPNRSDAICHMGVARDLSASLHRHFGKVFPLIIPDVSEFKETSFENPISIEIKDKERCQRYSGLYMRNVKISESPDWLKTSLRSIGIRPVNNIVDIGQFVMLECGQPMHAFDASKIKGNKVVVRCAEEGELFVTLDGIERKLNKEDLLICNEREPMCMAGIMGGEYSGISSSTRDIFLESAYFQAASIRKTAKRHALKTEASFRYERTCDPNNTIYALKRAALLIQEIAGGEISCITDVYPKPIEKIHISFPLEKLNKLSGQIIEKKIVVQILKDLEIEILKDENNVLELAIPTNKADVTRVADVIEEVLRIYGYNNINSPDHFEYRPSALDENPILEIKEIISTYLSDNGFFEIMNNSLTKSEYSNFDFIDKTETIGLINPLSKDLQNMRQTLMFGGLESIANNINHSNFDICLYEFGNIYHRNTKKTKKDSVIERFPHEYKLGIWVSGKLHETSWEEKARDVDFFYLKNMVLNSLIKSNFQIQRMKTQTIEKENALLNVLKYSFRQQDIFEIGEVNPLILKYFGIKQDVYYAEIDCDKLITLMERKKTIFKELNKFPEVNRDLSLLVDKNISYEQIEKLAFRTDPFIKSVNLFDVYEDENLEAGKISYAVSFVISNPDKTFTNGEIQVIMDKLILAYEKNIGAKLR